MKRLPELALFRSHSRSSSSVSINGHLTTPGTAVREMLDMVEDLGLKIEVDY